MITTEMLAPITTAITTNLALLTPVGIGLMAAMVGISLIPKVIYKFF